MIQNYFCGHRGSESASTSLKTTHLCAQAAHVPKHELPPPPPLEISPPCNPHPGGGGARHFTVLLGNIYCGGLCSPSVTHTFLHCFPIASNQSPVCIL